METPNVNPQPELATDGGLPTTSCSASSDTPETDEAARTWIGNAMTPWDLARKLERERNAALKGWSDTGTEYACLRLDLEELQDAAAEALAPMLLNPASPRVKKIWHAAVERARALLESLPNRGVV